MSKYNTNRKGFSVVEVLVLIAVVGLIGFVGYTFYGNYLDKNAVSDTQDSNQQSDNNVSEAPEITETRDLDAAAAVLDSENTESDTSEFDSEVTNF